MSDSPPVFEFEFTFTETFIRNALKRDVIWRLVVLVLVFLMGVAAIAWLMGARPWELPTMPALVAGLIAGAIAIPLKFNSIVKRTFAVWERLAPDRTISFRLFAEAIEVKMPNGNARHEWRGMRRLWRYHDIWLLEIVKLNSVLFPSDAPQDARDYVVERCTAAGVRI